MVLNILIDGLPRIVLDDALELQLVKVNKPAICRDSGLDIRNPAMLSRSPQPYLSIDESAHRGRRRTMLPHFVPTTPIL